MVVWMGCCPLLVYEQRPEQGVMGGVRGAAKAGRGGMLAGDWLGHLMGEYNSGVRREVDHLLSMGSGWLPPARGATVIQGGRRWAGHCRDWPIRCPHSVVGCGFYGMDLSR